MEFEAAEVKTAEVGDSVGDIAADSELVGGREPADKEYHN